MYRKKNKKVARVVALLVAAAMLLMTFFYVFAMTGWFGTAMEKRGFFVNAASSGSTGEVSDTVTLSEADYNMLYGSILSNSQATLNYRVAALEELILEIQEMYKDEVSLDTLFNGVYEGLFDSLGDPWSVYYPSSEIAEQLVTNIQGEYGGIGVSMRMDSDKVMVTATVADSPADNAGIQSGDYIVKVDNTNIEGMAIEDVSLLIRGEVGTSVTLTIERAGIQKLFTMTRRMIKTVSVSSTMLEGNIGYIQISSFDSNTDDEFKAARLTLLNQGMKGMIIDVRDNGGGLMSSAIDIADQMIPSSGIIAYYQRQGEIIETVSSTVDSTKSVPTVLLINENTASASECLAGALKDRKIATLVGETTYGKGVAQIVSETEEGTAVKLSIFYFLTPNKTRIDGNGITPDILVNGSGYLSEEEITEIAETLAPMTESVKYFAGGVGLNVYAAQQRLQYLGYEAELTAVMDEKTVAAIKKFQADHKLYAYGGLDFSTTKALATAFDAYVNPKTEDVQLIKAVETLTK